MEPITIIALGLFFTVRYGITDLVAAARGTDPARVVARRERHERAQARGGPSLTSAVASRVAGWLDPSTTRPQKERGPFLRWVASVWRDSWEHAGEVHARREEQRKAGELPRQKAWRWARDRVQQRGGPVKAEAQRLDRCDDCGGTYDEHCPDCESCVPDEKCDAGTCVEATDLDDDPADWWDDAPAAATTPEPQPAATVHPIRPDSEGTPDMATSSGPTIDGETYSPETGVAFAEQVAAQSAGISQSCETSQANLSKHLTGRALTLLSTIQEHQDASNAAAAELGGIFKNHVELADQARNAEVNAGEYLGA